MYLQEEEEEEEEEAVNVLLEGFHDKLKQKLEKLHFFAFLQ
jgi:hypothetical protein